MERIPSVMVWNKKYRYNLFVLERHMIGCENMETNQREELRYAMETQFRYNFYKSPEFPFLPSLGIRHIFQGFEAKEEELGFIGMLHLWWTKEDNGIKYDNPRQFVKGTWHGEWFDSPEEGIKRAIQVQ